MADLQLEVSQALTTRQVKASDCASRQRVLEMKLAKITGPTMLPRMGKTAQNIQLQAELHKVIAERVDLGNEIEIYQNADRELRWALTNPSRRSTNHAACAALLALGYLSQSDVGFSRPFRVADVVAWSDLYRNEPDLADVSEAQTDAVSVIEEGGEHHG